MQMKKKILSMTLALCMVFGSAAALPESQIVDQTAVSASAATSDWSYSTTTGGIKITKYNGKQAKVTIPSKLGGKAVVSIGFNAFSNNTTLTSVTIPDSVTEIDGSFYKCSNLQNVKGMKKVKNIASGSFSYCSRLTGITLPNTLETIGSYAFEHCTSLRSISIPASVKKISINPFSHCTSLTAIEVKKGSKYYSYAGNALVTADKKTLIAVPGGKRTYIIPSTITSINSYAFEGCSKLTSITVPKGVKTIGTDVFSYCTSLQSISLPSGLTSIGSWAFNNCTSLKAVTLPEGITSVNSYLFNRCTNLQKVTIPSTVKDITDTAFYGCSKLTNLSVNSKNKTFCSINGDIYSKNKKTLVLCARGKTALTIPSYVTAVDDHACADCSKLGSITIPGSVKSFGSYAFENTPWINALRRKNPAIVKNGVLIDARKSTAKTFVVPSGVKVISKYAFADNNTITAVVIPGSVKTIREGAFFRCSKLASLVIPDTVTSIEKGIVNGCDKLVTFKTGNGIKKLPGLTCGGCDSLLNVVIGKNVTSIGEQDFAECKSLASIEIPHNVTKIGNFAFAECAKLADVNLPYSKLTIGNGAFYKCNSLNSIVVPDTVKSIGYSAFSKSSYATTKTNPVIYGYNKSLAQKYAKSNNHTFKTLPPYQRIAGDNRYGTAVAISKQSFKSTSKYVILTTGMDFHDALAAVPLAKAYNAPLLLTAPNALVKDTLTEIKRLKAKNVIVVNTKNAINSSVIKSLKNNKLSVTNITGKTSFETSKKVAEALQAKVKSNTKNKTTAPSSVFFTTDKAFADALSVSPVAALKGAPILYVDPSKKTLDSNITSYLKKVKGSVKNIYIVGGTVAIPKALETSIKKALPKGKVTRFAGANRYETCVLVNNHFKKDKTLTSKSICVAKGLDFPDALAGGVYAANNKAPLFLADNTLSAKQESYLKNKNSSKIVLFGGVVAVPDKILGKVSKSSVK